MTNHQAGITSAVNARVLRDSVAKLDPRYLATNNPVMFAVELAFFLVAGIAAVPHGVSELVTESEALYVEVAGILLITIWFATFSESLSEAQARARVDSLRGLEKEVKARKVVNGKETIVTSTSLNPGDEVRVFAGEVIPRDGLVAEGKAFIDESMMTGESNPVFKEKGDHVIGGTRVASDNILVEITSEAGRSFLDQMVGLIESATRPKTQNEIALTILLSGLSLIFIMVIGSLPFMVNFLGYKSDVAMLVTLLVALMPTTIGGLLPAIGVAGIARLGRDNIIAKSGKGIEAAGDCDILILDKTGTITEGSRSAIAFIPLQNYTEQDVGEAAFAASIHDTTHEGKSTVDLAEQRKFVPIGVMEKILTAKAIEFSAETCYSGIELIPARKGTLTKEQSDAIASAQINYGDGSQSPSARSRVDAMLQDLGGHANARIIKGSLQAVLPLVENANEAELRWKAQQVSQSGGTPLVVAIGKEALGIIALKDELKEKIRSKLDEVRSTGISTVMITGDNRLAAEVIGNEAGVDEVMAEAKPTDKLLRVQQEQAKGHIIGMVGDGTNDAPALAKADVGLAMNSGTAAAKEAANMVDLDSDPSKILRVVKLGKQLLMTRGAITTFSIANDVAKYFAVLPAMFGGFNPKLQSLNVMQLHSPETAVLSTLIFNAIIIPALIPLSLRGVRFKAEPPQKTFLRNMLIFGLGGVTLPFLAIKAIDMALALFMR